MNYLGDFLHGQIIDLKWGSNAADGSSIARSTDGNIRIYKGNNVAQRSSSAGITDTEGFDGLTGINHLRIDTADNTDAGFYLPGFDYQVVLEGATIDGVSGINAVIGSFSIENRGQYKILGSFAIASGSTTTAVLSGSPRTSNDAYNNMGVRVWHTDGTVDFRSVNDYVYSGGAGTVHFDAMLTACASGDRLDFILGAPATVVGTMDANMVSVTGSTGRATQAGRAFDNILTGTVTETGFAPTTTQFRLVLSQTLGFAANIQNKWLRWRTGNLAYHEARIKTCTLVSGSTYLIEVAQAMPGAPAGDDECEIP